MADDKIIEDENQPVKEVKQKKKIVWAKNKKEGTLAVIVTIAFFANTIYTVLKLMAEYRVG